MSGNMFYSVSIHFFTSVKSDVVFWKMKSLMQLAVSYFMNHVNYSFLQLSYGWSSGYHIWLREWFFKLNWFMFLFWTLTIWGSHFLCCQLCTSLKMQLGRIPSPALCDVCYVFCLSGPHINSCEQRRTLSWGCCYTVQVQEYYIWC